MTDILLIHPPVVKPSEPPLSLAVLTAAVKARNFSVAAVDANLMAFQFLLQGERLTPLAGARPSTTIHRALKHRQASWALLHSSKGSESFARYSSAVHSLNRLLGLWSSGRTDEGVTLGDFHHASLSPFAPEDLQALAEGRERTLFLDFFQQELLPQLEALRPRLISLTINYLHQALPAFELAGLLRRHFPTATLAAGGGLISSWQEPLRRLNLHLPPFDRLIFGPGENLLPALLQGTTGDDYFLTDAGEIGFVPDYAFARLEEYFSPEPILPLNASRGCYWQNCLFCPEASAPVHPFAGSAPAAFVDLLLRLSREHGVKYFHLTDNAIPIPILKSLAAQCEKLSRLRWFGFVRFERILEDEDFVRQLAASGCRMLQLGLESGSQAVLDRLGKGIELDSAARILENLHAAGIASYVYIMLGTPGEGEEDAELTRMFLEKHADRIGFLNLAIMNLPQGSELLSDPQQYGILNSQPQDRDKVLGLYRSFQTAGGWDRAAARRFLARRLLGSPKIRAIVKRTPPLFTSNHAVFFARAARSANRTPCSAT